MAQLLVAHGADVNLQVVVTAGLPSCIHQWVQFHPLPIPSLYLLFGLPPPSPLSLSLSLPSQEVDCHGSVV